MTNNLYPFLYNIYTQAPPAGVILSRLYGGKISNKKSVFDRILEEPTGISYFDEQIMRESGVKGMKPMDVQELTQYIKAWLTGLVENVNEMTSAEVEDEMKRLKAALDTTVTMYRINGGKEKNIVMMLDDLDRTYGVMARMYDRLVEEGDQDMINELHYRREIARLSDSPADQDEREMLERSLAEIVQRRKNNEVKREQLNQIQASQLQSRETWDQQWAAYLQGLIDELQLSSEKLDPNNPRESFSRILRTAIEQNGGNGNVTKYLSALRDALGPIMTSSKEVDPDFREIDLLIQQAASNPGFQQMLIDIRNYYIEAFKWKKQSQEVLGRSMEVLRKIKAKVGNFDIGNVMGVNQVFDSMLKGADELLKRVSDLEEEVASLTFQLEEQKTTVIRASEAAKMYRDVLSNILSYYKIPADTLNQTNQQTLFESIAHALDELITKRVGASGQMQTAAVNSSVNTYLYQLLDILKRFEGYTLTMQQTNQIIPQDRINEILAGIRGLPITSPGIDPGMQERMVGIRDALAQIVEQIAGYSNTMVKAYNFFLDVQSKVSTPGQSPDKVLQDLELLQNTMASYNQSMQQGALSVQKMNDFMQMLIDENHQVKGNLQQLQLQNKAEMDKQAERIRLLQQQLQDNDELSRKQLADAQAQLAQNKKAMEEALAAQRVEMEANRTAPQFKEDNIIAEFRKLILAQTAQIKASKDPEDVRKVFMYLYNVYPSKNRVLLKQMCKDLWGFFDACPVPTLSNRAYGVVLYMFFLYWVYVNKYLYDAEIESGNKVPTTPDWTAFLDTLSTLWRRYFIHRATNYISISALVVLLFVTKADFDATVTSVKEIITRYNSIVLSAINLSGNVSSAIQQFRKQPFTDETVAAFMNDIRYTGCNRYFPDFILAWMLFRKIKDVSVLDQWYGEWFRASEDFTIDSGSGLSLGKFLLPGQGADKASTKEWFLCAFAPYFPQDDTKLIQDWHTCTRTAENSKVSLTNYCKKWTVIS